MGDGESPSDIPDFGILAELQTVGAEYIKIIKTFNSGGGRNIKLTSDLGGEVSRVASYKQLQLLIKVAALQIDVPGSNSCREGAEGAVSMNESMTDTRETGQTRLGFFPMTMSYTYNKFSHKRTSSHFLQPFTICCCRASSLPPTCFQIHLN